MIFNDKQFQILLSLLLIVILTGTIFYHFAESLSWTDSFYFSGITLTTVGYGDIYPHTTAGKIFTVFYVLGGLGIMFGFVNYLAKKEVKRLLRNRVEKDLKK